MNEAVSNILSLSDICPGLIRTKGLTWRSGGLSAGGEGSMCTEYGQLRDVGNRKGGKGGGLTNGCWKGSWENK